MRVCDYNTSHKDMNSFSKREILRQIAAIAAMERGKLSTYSFKGRSAEAGPYHKLQQWHNGKNVTRYIPLEEVPAVEEALAGYTLYRQLTQEYAAMVIDETRRRIRRIED